MNFKKLWNKIPKLPLTALLFYFAAFTFWNLGWIPAPKEIVLILENLYMRFGLFGLFIATFLEGIAYLGMYFPGSFIIALAVILSNGSLPSLFIISTIVGSTLTITACINYSLGKYISLNKISYKKYSLQKKLSGGLFLSMLHPNTLAFYFFDAGLEKRDFWKIIFVPIIMIPYGFALGLLFYFFKESTRNAIEGPYLVIILIFIWITTAFLLEYKKNSTTKV